MLDMKRFRRSLYRYLGFNLLLPGALLVGVQGVPTKRSTQEVPTPKLVSNGFEGYISMAVEAPPAGYGYGVSLYATAWPLTEKPLRDFQIGLASIWIVPDNRTIKYSLLPKGTFARDNWPERGPSYGDVFETIEGGLGFWGDTRFGSTTAKFRMNGTTNGYNYMVSTSGWGFGGGANTASLKDVQMDIAQLSNHILVPPDGFTFKKGTNGDLLGYAWMALPLIPSNAITDGLNVPTGNQSWTLFLNTKNCKGPVAFWTPVSWSRISLHYPPAVGRGLDAREGLVTGGAIEVNTVPRYTSTDSKGNDYSKVPLLQFPVDSNNQTVLIHNLTQYSKKALYNQVLTWINGGSASSGEFNSAGAVIPTVRANPLILQQGDPKVNISGLEDYVQTKALDKTTFGLEWKSDATSAWTKNFRKGVFPQYFEKSGNQLTPVKADDVPTDTGLIAEKFPTSVQNAIYSSPKSGENSWHRPGPVAGPFYAKLSDGSVVTYYWYRFIDQPAMQNADLSSVEKSRLQHLVERLQTKWTVHKQYMAPPSRGKLAALDPALVVKPPKRFETGYVPIAVRQEIASGRSPGK